MRFIQVSRFSSMSNCVENSDTSIQIPNIENRKIKIDCTTDEKRDRVLMILQNNGCTMNHSKLKPTEFNHFYRAPMFLYVEYGKILQNEGDRVNDFIYFTNEYEKVEL